MLESLLRKTRIGKVLQCAVHMFVDFHNGGLVTASVAVIWCGEDSDDVALVTPIVSVHDELMGASNSLKAVCLVKLLGNVLTEGIASTTRRDAPTAAVIRVRPKQVANWAFMRHLLNAIELTNLVKRVN